MTDHLQGRGRVGGEEREAQTEFKQLIHNLTTGRSRHLEATLATAA